MLECRCRGDGITDWRGVGMAGVMAAGIFFFRKGSIGGVLVSVSLSLNKRLIWVLFLLLLLVFDMDDADGGGMGCIFSTADRLKVLVLT